MAKPRRRQSRPRKLKPNQLSVMVLHRTKDAMALVDSIRARKQRLAAAIAERYAPRLRDGECPVHACKASLRAMQNPNPGTPSRHLLAEAARASKGTSRALSGSAPKADMESMSSARPRPAVTAAISAIGFSKPEVVSQ